MEYYNIAFERSVLSSFLYEPILFDKYKTTLRNNDFYLPSHKAIFESMINLLENDKPIDEEFIKQDLSKKNLFDDIVMLEIMSANPISNIESYISEIKELSKQRKTITLSTHLKDDVSLSDKLDLIKNTLNDIENDVEFIDEFTADEIMNMEFEHRPTYETGIDVIQSTIGGLERGQLIYITGAEETGKTHLTYKIMENLSAGFKVGIISLEFGKVKLKERLEGMIRRGHKLEPRNIKASFECHSINKLEKIVLKWFNEGVRFIVVDSFNLIENNKSSDNNANVIDTGKRLFKLTQQLDILMMVISTSTKADHKEKNPSIYGGQLLNHYCDQKWHILRDLETEDRMLWINKNKQNYIYAKEIMHFMKDGSISRVRYEKTEFTSYESEKISMETI